MKIEDQTGGVIDLVIIAFFASAYLLLADACSETGFENVLISL